MKMHNPWKVSVTCKDVSFNHSSGEKAIPVFHSNSDIIMMARMYHRNHNDVLLVVKGSCKHKSVRINLEKECRGRVYLTVVVIGERMTCTFDSKPVCEDEWYIKACETEKFEYGGKCYDCHYNGHGCGGHGCDGHGCGGHGCGGHGCGGHKHGCGGHKHCNCDHKVYLCGWKIVVGI